MHGTSKTKILKNLHPTSHRGLQDICSTSAAKVHFKREREQKPWRRRAQIEQRKQRTASCPISGHLPHGKLNRLILRCSDLFTKLHCIPIRMHLFILFFSHFCGKHRMRLQSAASYVTSSCDARIYSSGYFACQVHKETKSCLTERTALL